MKQKKLSVSKKTLIDESWRRGLLSWKLYKHQRQIYDAVWSAIRDDGVLKYVINCSRRFGKTTILCLVSIEYAIRNPNTHIRFASKTSISLRKSVFPIMKMLLQIVLKTNYQPFELWIRCLFSRMDHRFTSLEQTMDTLRTYEER